MANKTKQDRRAKANRDRAAARRLEEARARATQEAKWEADFMRGATQKALRCKEGEFLAYSVPYPSGFKRFYAERSKGVLKTWRDPDGAR